MASQVIGALKLVQMDVVASNLFIPSTIGRTKGKYWPLIFDGHDSHLTPEFDEICSQNDIIPICMPAHTSHLLQSLDISCFAMLKRSYGQLVETRMRFGINHIDKLDLLEAYPQAQIKAIKSQTIKNSFTAAGLLPSDPDQMFSALNIHLRTPTPLEARVANQTTILHQKPLLQRSNYAGKLHQLKLYFI